MGSEDLDEADATQEGWDSLWPSNQFGIQVGGVLNARCRIAKPLGAGLNHKSVKPQALRLNL